MLEEVVLCAASAYTKKFYLNQAFSQLPPHIKNELKIMCVLFTEDIGGTLTLFLMRMARCSFGQMQMKGICSMMRLGAC